jgi:hypothetical protein
MEKPPTRGFGPDGRPYGWPVDTDVNGTVWLNDVDGRRYCIDRHVRSIYLTDDGTAWRWTDPRLGRRESDPVVAYVPIRTSSTNTADKSRPRDHTADNSPATPKNHAADNVHDLRNPAARYRGCDLSALSETDRRYLFEVYISARRFLIRHHIFRDDRDATPIAVQVQRALLPPYERERLNLHDRIARWLEIISEAYQIEAGQDESSGPDATV